MLQNQLANWGDKMFNERMAKTVRNHAFMASLCTFLPIVGFDALLFIGVLWHMYSSLCEQCGKSFGLGSVIVGIVVNVAVYVVIDLLLALIPVIGWLGTSFIVYLQFYSSGKSYIETLKAA